MMKMSRQRFLRWEKQRLKGKRFFIAKTAVVSGVFFFVVMNMASWAWSGSPLSERFVLVYIVLGLLTGMALWSFNEDRFAAFIVAKKANATPIRKR